MEDLCLTRALCMAYRILWKLQGLKLQCLLPRLGEISNKFCMLVGPAIVLGGFGARDSDLSPLNQGELADF